MKQALVVLGMHRSGTSSIAGALSLLGARAPATLLDPAPDNPRGFWESREIIARNDELLTLGGSYWRDWRRFEIATVGPTDLSDWRTRLAQTLDDEFGRGATIVLKDPRMCRLSDGWDTVLSSIGYHPRFILPIRPPLEVARSLARRNGLTVAEGLLLWLRHVLDAEISTRGRPRRIMVWGDFMQDWRAEIAGLAGAIGWTPKRTVAIDAQVDAFLDTGLRNERLGDGDVLPDPEAHPWAEAVFSIHAAMARNGEDAASHVRLDDLRATFDLATQVFSRQVGSLLWEAEKAALDRDAAVLAAATAEDRERQAIRRLAEADRERARSTVMLGQSNRRVLDGERRAVDQARQIDEANQRIADLARVLDRAHADHQAVAELLETERLAHGHERDGHRLSRDRIADQSRTIDALTTQAEATDRIVDDLTGRIAVLNADLADLRTRIQNLDTALAEAQSARADDARAHGAEASSLRAEIARLSMRLDEEILAHHDLREALRRRPVRTAWAEWSPAARAVLLGRRDES